MRLKRRHLLTGYIRVPEYTKSGLQHLHIIFRGSYIDQAYLSALWHQLHGAKVVDIRAIKNLDGKRGMANYMAKYMTKELAGRYSWDWGWVWRGFCRDWTHLKKLWRYLVGSGTGNTFQDLLRWWRLWLKGYWTPDFTILPVPP